MRITRDYATKYLGKEVTVTIDRPLNSKHPNYDWIYQLNYGYIPDTKAPDGEEIDAYIIGISEPLITFRGVVVAVIQRENNNDDKLIVTKDGHPLSKKDIREATKFQEQFFSSKIILRD